MILQYDAKVVQTKVVYYGPAMSGKTTSLRALFATMKPGAEVKSIETSTGRTLFFDFGTLDVKGLEWTIKITLYSTTGQDFYQSTRPATLFGVDGIVFVADAQRSIMPYNKQSWNELHGFLSSMKKDVPVVVCMNKIDMPDVVSAEELRAGLELPRDRAIGIMPAIASQGIGVKEAFGVVMSRLFPNFQFAS
ncbi:MAG: GTPase domain-containing protein [Candidatus Lokiarchaeota archaeon]|nr:GTPase domain-containing protein [Candidatus Lokiarchaeota archaeon]